jgi:hypothetical protein
MVWTTGFVAACPKCLLYPPPPLPKGLIIKAHELSGGAYTPGLCVGIGTHAAAPATAPRAASFRKARRVSGGRQRRFKSRCCPSGLAGELVRVDVVHSLAARSRERQSTQAGRSSQLFPLHPIPFATDAAIGNRGLYRFCIAFVSLVE